MGSDSIPSRGTFLPGREDSGHQLCRTADERCVPAGFSANVFGGSLFRELETRHTNGIGQSVVLVGGDGHYVYDSREQNDWNRLIALREEDNLQKDYGPAIAGQILPVEKESSRGRVMRLSHMHHIPPRFPGCSRSRGRISIPRSTSSKVFPMSASPGTPGRRLRHTPGFFLPSSRAAWVSGSWRRDSLPGRSRKSDGERRLSQPGITGTG